MLISKYFFQFVDQMSWECICVLSCYMHIMISQQRLFSLNIVRNLFHSLLPYLQQSIFLLLITSQIVINRSSTITYFSAFWDKMYTINLCYRNISFVDLTVIKLVLTNVCHWMHTNKQAIKKAITRFLLLIWHKHQDLLKLLINCSNRKQKLAHLFMCQSY